MILPRRWCRVSTEEGLVEVSWETTLQHQALNLSFKRKFGDRLATGRLTSAAAALASFVRVRLASFHQAIYLRPRGLRACVSWICCIVIRHFCVYRTFTTAVLFNNWCWPGAWIWNTSTHAKLKIFSCAVSRLRSNWVLQTQGQTNGKYTAWVRYRSHNKAFLYDSK